MKIDQFVSDWSKNIRAKPKSQFLRSSTRRAPTMARPGTVDYGKWDKLAAEFSDDEEAEEVAQEERRQRDQLDREQRSRLLPGTFVDTFAKGLGWAVAIGGLSRRLLFGTLVVILLGLVGKWVVGGVVAWQGVPGNREGCCRARDEAGNPYSKFRRLMDERREMEDEARRAEEEDSWEDDDEDYEEDDDESEGENRWKFRSL